MSLQLVWKFVCKEYDWRILAILSIFRVFGDMCTQVDGPRAVWKEADVSLCNGTWFSDLDTINPSIIIVWEKLPKHLSLP